MRRITFILLFISICTQVFAQFSISEAEVLFQSRHTWRGTKFGTAPAIEPSVTATKGNFSFNVWASLTTNNTYSEIDLIPSWQFGEYTLSLYDYYNPVAGEKNGYLTLNNGECRHSLEVSIDNYSGEKCPLKWYVGTFFANDKNEETGKPYFSTYIELKYPFSFLKIDAEPFIGATPFKSFYAEKLAVINSGMALSKEIKLSKTLSIPVVLTYTFNPYEENHFVTLGTGIAFTAGE